MPLAPAPLLFYAFSLWLGASLLARDTQKTAVRLTGWGLVAYAGVLAAQMLFGHLIPAILLIPPLLWVGAAIQLLPEQTAARETLVRAWAIAAIPIAILTALDAWFALLVIAALFACAGLLLSIARHSPFKAILRLLAVIALFITLSTGLLVLPLGWLPQDWGIALLGVDLVCLGLVVTVWDAFDEGQSIRAPLLRSFISALYDAGALAVLVILAAAWDGTPTRPAWQWLLFALVSFGVLTQVFADAIQTLLDALTFSGSVYAGRAALRSTADALPRLSALDPALLDDEQFVRLTRRAIAQLGDLPKLAASPLTNLPLLASAGPNPLERAHALKDLLTESILRLKPQGQAAFGRSDEWRFYNALYFPYVLGLKPFTRLPGYDALDAPARQALDWFRSSVPERTLHNWQNSAARLVAEDIQSRLREAVISRESA